MRVVPVDRACEEDSKGSRDESHSQLPYGGRHSLIPSMPKEESPMALHRGVGNAGGYLGHRARVDEEHTRRSSDARRPSDGRRPSFSTASFTASPATRQRYLQSPAALVRYMSIERLLARERTMVEEVAAFRKLLSNKHFVLDPSCKLVRQWDGGMLFALIFTAIMAPFEVGFFTDDQVKLDARFFTNGVIDIVFFVDIYMQFLICFHSKGNKLITSRRIIAQRYLTGWFAPDIISCVPMDVVAIWFTSKSHKKLLRLLRLLRLIKLIRVTRAKRIIARWRAAAVFSFSQAQLSMLMLICELFFFLHWIACIWGMAAHESFTGNRARTWLVAYTEKMTDGDGRKHFHVGSAAEKYTAALYFAIYTMTGIGYGDITPVNHRELATCICIMLSAAMFWAFMIGNICSIASTKTIHESAYRSRMDQINSMMVDQNFPPELQRRCRLFLMNSREYQRTAFYPQLYKQMSSSLSGEMSAAVNGSWLRGVWYFKDASAAFVVDLSSILERKMYAPNEAIDSYTSTLFVLRNGIAARRSRVLSKGAAWGVDFLLEPSEFIDRVCAAALSYVEVLCIAREDMLILLENPDYAEESATIMRGSKWYLVRSQCLSVGRRSIELRKSINLERR